MITSTPFRSFRRAVGVAVGFLLASAFLHAQPATGAIEGRVFNAATGAALARARIVVEGAARETTTETDGTFRLDGLPGGPVRLGVNYLGFQRQTVEVAVPAGGIVRREIELKLLGADGPLQLADFQRELVRAGVELDWPRLETSRSHYSHHELELKDADTYYFGEAWRL
jgi:hypothetical protein